MTDVELLEKKLAFVETCLRELAGAQVTKLGHDVREQRYVEHTLQIAIQAVLDVAAHIVSDERLGEPETNKALFELLARGGWLPEHLVASLRNMAGFRNVLVHGYTDVDLDVVRDVLANRLGDLDAFVVAVRGRLPR